MQLKALDKASKWTQSNEFSFWLLDLVSKAKNELPHLLYLLFYDLKCMLYRMLHN